MGLLPHRCVFLTLETNLAPHARRPTPAVRRVMLAILWLHVFQQGCGMGAMVLYAPRVFSHVGITSERAVLGATVLLGVSKTAAIVSPLFLAAVEFMAMFSLGFGTVTMMYGSEILPLRLRGQGTGVGMAVNRMMSAVVGMTFISMYEAVGMAGTFCIFAAMSVAASVFVYACQPETKGRSLEEMEALFDGGVGAGADAALS